MNACGTCETPRNFLTKEEKTGMLKEYKNSLEQEAKAVAEKITELEE
jgi:hypothetical protein